MQTLRITNAAGIANDARVLLITLLLGGCSVIPEKDGAPARPIDVGAIPDAVPRPEPLSKYGNPASYQVNGITYQVLADSAGYRERGIASWYGNKFHGQRTSSGEPYDMYAMTAAHRSLPLPCYARVTNLQNGRSVVVKINDRGPFHDNRLIDLSYAAAARLDILSSGTGMVEMQVIDGRESAVSAPVTASSGVPPRLYLQLGAFGQADNAQRMADKLKEHGFQPIILPVQSGGELLHRVRLGPLSSVDAADDLERKLSQLGFAQRHVVVE